MGTINNLSGPGELFELLQGMEEGELVGQQICQKGAIGALEFLLQHGCTPELAGEMLASLRANMLMVEEVARSKGFDRVFDDSNTAFH